MAGFDLDGRLIGSDGDDSISINTVKTGSTLRGEKGNDSIIVNTVEPDLPDQLARIYGDAGDDSLLINNVSGGIVDGGIGNDTIEVTKATDAVISGGPEDLVHIEGALPYAEAPQLIVNLLETDANSLTYFFQDNVGNHVGEFTLSHDGGYSFTPEFGAFSLIQLTVFIEGNEYFLGLNPAVGNVITGTIEGVNIADNADIIRVEEAIDTNISGGGGNDQIIIGTALGGSITGSEGVDTITFTKEITTATNVASSWGDDSIFIHEGIGVGGTLTLTGEKDSLTVAMSKTAQGVINGVNLQGGAIVGSAGEDSIYINNFNNGMTEQGDVHKASVSAGSSDDFVSIENFNAEKDINGEEIALSDYIELGEGHGYDHLKITKNNSNYTDTDFATLIYENEGKDTLEVDWAFDGTFDASRGDVLISKGLGPNAKIIYGDADDNVIYETALSNVNVGTSGGNDTVDAHSATNVHINTTRNYEESESISDNDSVVIHGAFVNSSIVTGVGSDNVQTHGALTNSLVNVGSGADSVDLASVGAGSMVTMDADGVDNIRIGGTYNDGMVQTSGAFNNVNGVYAGIATGDDGGSVTLDTWGTGNLQFGEGQDTLHVNKAFSGVNGLKDVFTQAGEDSILLKSVSNAEIHAGSNDDVILVETLGANAEVYGDAGNDSVAVQKVEESTRSVDTIVMSNGLIDGGAGDDTVTVGNESTLLGTLRGGKILGGAGDDELFVTTLSGTGIIDAGEDNDFVTVSTMSGGTVNGGEGVDTVDILTMSGGTVNGDADADTVGILTMNGGTVNGGVGDDMINITDNTENPSSGLLRGGIINGGEGEDRVGIYEMRGGIVNGDAGADILNVLNMYAGTINGGEGNDNLAAVTLNGGTFNGGEGDDILYSYSTMSGGTLNGDAGNDNLQIVGGMNGGVLNGGDGNDSFAVQGELNNSKILGGAGDDIFYAKDGIIFGKGYTIDLGTGDNLIDLKEFDLTDQTLTLGAAHDNVVTSGIINSTINLGGGNNAIDISGDMTNAKIISGAGNDSVTFTPLDTYVANGFNINTGTGNDSITMESELFNEENSITGTITYDNRGQDTITLEEYREGMVVDSKGATIALSTGADGGTINASSWTSGNMSFGNGHDSVAIESITGEEKNLTMGAGNDLLEITSLNADINLDMGAGNDSLFVVGRENNATITDTELAAALGAGNDTLMLGWSFDGTYAAGNDGGTLAALGLGENATLTFGSGNDGLVLLGPSATLNHAIDLKTGTDTILLSSVDIENGGSLTFDTKGIDGIVLDTYDGSGINENSGGLSTGNDGGLIQITDWTGGEIAFGDGNDSFVIEGTLTRNANLMKGNDAITIAEIEGGSITYDHGGLDSINLFSTYDGTGINEGSGGLSTGDDGGKIQLFDITKAGIDNITFGKGNDTFTISSLSNEDSIKGINLGLGNNSLDATTVATTNLIYSNSGADTFNAGNVTGMLHAGSGNNTLTIDTLAEGGVFASGLGNDFIDITHFNGGKLVAGNGNNTISVDFFAEGTIDGGANVDTVKIDSFSGTQNTVMNTGAGNDSVTIVSIGDYANSKIVNLAEGNDKISISDVGLGGVDVSADAGNDSFILGLVQSGNFRGDEGNDTFTVTEMQKGNILGGEGNDSFFVNSISSTATLSAENGNDILRILKATNGVINGGDGADTLILTDMNSAQINAGLGNDSVTISNTQNSMVDLNEGNDRLTITTMSGGIVLGEGGADTIVVTNMQGGGVYGHTNDDEAVGYDTDVITITNMIGGSVYADAGDDIVNITTMNGGYVSGQDDDDKITVKTAEGVYEGGSPHIVGGNGDDTISVTTAKYSVIMGDDTTESEYGGNDLITVNAAIDSVIDGGLGDDTINATIVNRSDIFGDSGEDFINLGTVYESSIYGGKSDEPTSEASTIKVVTLSDNSVVYGAEGDDSVTVTTHVDSVIDGLGGEDTITVVTATRAVISGDDGSDSIKVTTVNGSSVWGGAENDSITIGTATGKIAFAKAGVEVENAGSDTIMAHTVIDGGEGDDVIDIGTTTQSFINGGVGNDAVFITNIHDGNSIDLGNGNDALHITSNKSTLSDTEIANLIASDGNDSLLVNWAFNGHFDASLGDTENTDIDGGTLSTKGLGKEATFAFGDGDDGLLINGQLNRAIGTEEGQLHLNFGAGDDHLMVSSKTAVVDDSALAATLGQGNDTLQVGWAFNGEFVADETGDTLITNGLETEADLDFGDGDDGFYSSANIIATSEPRIISTQDGNDTIEVTAITNVAIASGEGDDTIAIKGTATRSEVDAGIGADSVYIKSMDTVSTLTYDVDGKDSIHIGGTYSNGMVLSTATGEEPTEGIATGEDGGSVTLETWGTGQVYFSSGDDTLTVTKLLSNKLADQAINTYSGNDSLTLHSINNVAINTLEGSDTVHIENTANNSFINMGNGNDSILLDGNATNVHIDLGTGSDTAVIHSMLGTSTFTYIIDGNDDISISGTFNDGMVFAEQNGSTFAGIATGEDGSRITINTWGTGNVEFNNGNDYFNVKSAINGSIGLKDAFTLDGDDTIFVSSITGAHIYAGSDNDSLTATKLGNGGELYGQSGDDTLLVGAKFSDESKQNTNVMSAGRVDGGEGDDLITIGNVYSVQSEEGISEVVRGTLNGGQVFGGSGNDAIVTATLAGAGFIDAESGDDAINVDTMAGGTMNGGNGVDILDITTLSGGIANGDAGNDVFKVKVMAGGTINGNDGADNMTIGELRGKAVINGGNDNDSINVSSMNGGTINGGEGSDTVFVLDMNAGVIHGTEGDNVSVIAMKGGTINGDAHSIGIHQMYGGIINGDGDTINIQNMHGGTISGGEGDEHIIITEYLGGSAKILGGAGDDTLTLVSNLSVGSGYTIDLGAGNNLIEVQSSLNFETLTLGASGDNVSANFLQNATINLGGGANAIQIDSAMHANIIGGTGSDFVRITGQFAEQSYVHLGTGNDTLVLAGEGSFINENGSIGGSVSYDNKGLDELIFTTYREGMVTDVNGNIVALSTGVDGGRIEINSWESGELSFGKGNDYLAVNTNSTGITDTELAASLGAGNDTLNLVSFDGVFNAGNDGGTLIVSTLGNNAELNFGTGNDGLILDYTSEESILAKHVDLKTGNDTLTVHSIDTENGGMLTYDNVGLDSITLGVYDGQGVNENGSGLSTGKDGGHITVASWTGGEIYFENGSDSFTLVGNLTQHANLMQGNDSINVVSIGEGGMITYDDRGQDTIVLGGYNGTGINESSSGLSTGVDGGSIRIETLTSDAGANSLNFNSGIDNLYLGAYDVTSADTTINLMGGNDHITVDNLYGLGAIDAGIGNDVFTIRAMVGGVAHGNQGNDKINITTLFEGEVYGNDGNDTFTIEYMHTSGERAGTVSGALGNDSFVITYMTAGTILGEEGADIFDIESILDGTVSGGDYADLFDIEHMQGGTVKGDEGNDRFFIDSMLTYGLLDTFEVFGGAGNDSFIVETAHHGTLSGEDGSDYFKLTTLAGTKLFGGNNADSFIIEQMNSGTVNGGDDKDNFEITSMSGDSEIYGDGGNDAFNITNMYDGSVHGGEGLDTITITNMYDGKVSTSEFESANLDASSDKIIITNMYGGEVQGSADNDVINVTTMLEGSVSARGGNDVITVKNITAQHDEGVDLLGHGGEDAITVSGLARNAYIDGGDERDSIKIQTAIDVVVKGGDGDDFINVITANRNNISGDAGSDSITITTAHTTVIRGDDSEPSLVGNDTIRVTTLSDGSYVNSGVGDDSIVIGKAIDSRIFGDEGDDSISITTATRSEISGGDGDNTISIQSMTEGKIFGGSGSTTYTIGLGKNADITILGESGQESITLNQNDGTTKSVYLSGFDSKTEGDTLSIGKVDKTAEVIAAMESGHASVTFDGISIYFLQ